MPKPVFPSAVDQVKHALRPSELLPERKINLGYNVITDKAAFEDVQNRFKNTSAGDGMTMEEFSRKYWAESEFREKVKQDIAMRRRK